MIWGIETASMFLLMSQFSHGHECEVRGEFTMVVRESEPTTEKSEKRCARMYTATKEVDCAEIFSSGSSRSGVYRIWPRSRVSRGRPLRVYCDMVTDGGGWTVIQRRGEFGREKDYFRKGWKFYKDGFGDIDKDFWLGNDNIYSLTNQDLYSARFDLKDAEGRKRYAVYDTFWIEDEDRKYTLHIKGYRGDAGDSMVSKHDNMKFTTSDQKNDNHPAENCADLDKGGWWYNFCHEANLNGIYFKGGKYESHNYDGIVWHAWKGYKESMAFTEIKIRPKDFSPPKMATNSNSPAGNNTCTPQ